MNSFIIEQTKEETTLAISVHQNAEISEVRLASAKASAGPPENLKRPISISFEVNAEQLQVPSGNLLIAVDFRLTGSKREEKSKSKIALSVECTFEVSYKLRPRFTPSAEQINAFKNGNAIFNCWPYCRQHVQDMLLRMGYPPLMLPFLRVATKRPKAQKL